jgi:hypothetical protein
MGYQFLTTAARASAPRELRAAVLAGACTVRRSGAARAALIRNVWGRSIEEAMAVTAGAIAARRVSPQGQEALPAFLEKRAPAWSKGVAGTPR